MKKNIGNSVKTWIIILLIVAGTLILIGCSAICSHKDTLLMLTPYTDCIDKCAEVYGICLEGCITEECKRECRDNYNTCVATCKSVP